MQLKPTKLNNERLSGNRLFLHTFRSFSTNNTKLSSKAYIVHALFFIIIFLSIIYMLLVVFTILNIVNKKEDLAIINQTNIASAKLNREYNTLSSKLTLDYALANGYEESKMQTFASRKSEAAGLSFLYKNN